jgi:hypothetical protein
MDAFVAAVMQNFIDSQRLAWVYSQNSLASPQLSALTLQNLEFLSMQQ